MPAASPLLQTTLALGLVLGLIAILAWLLRRLQRPGGGADAAIKLRGQLMVGPRERVVLLEVADQWIVAGVAAGSVRPLAVLPRPADAAPDIAAGPSRAPDSPPAADAGAGRPSAFSTLLDRARRPGGHA